VKKLILFLVVFMPLVLFPQRPKNSIKVVCSAALIERDYERRKQEYIKGLSIIRGYGYEPYVIEACAKHGPTFLETCVLPGRVFYSSVNNPKLKNKGVNEAATMLEGFYHFAFNDDDMIIKVTARYYLVSDYFITLAEENPECDAFVLMDPIYPGSGNVITGCFALRYKYFKEMFETLDFVGLEKEFRCLETDVARYIQKIEKQGAKIMRVKKLDLLARWALDGREVLY
jgi:hypothetical protein